MCWRLRKLLFCWSPMHSGWPLAKSVMPTPSLPLLAVFLCPRLNARTSWGCLWLPCGTWSFFCLPQSIVVFRLHLSYDSHTNPCLWGSVSSESFLAWWLMSITSSLDHWLTKERVFPLPWYSPSNESSFGETKRLEDLLEQSSYDRISRRRFFLNESLDFNRLL